MVLIIVAVGRPHDTPHSLSQANMTFQILGSCLLDLARKGLIQGVVDEEKVDSFNVANYSVSPQELEASVEQNGCFSIELMESFPARMPPDGGSKGQLLAIHMRAAMEVLVNQNFGEEILDELFDLYWQKFVDQPSIFVSGNGISFLAMLKRKAY